MDPLRPNRSIHGENKSEKSGQNSNVEIGKADANTSPRAAHQDSQMLSQSSVAASKDLVNRSAAGLGFEQVRDNFQRVADDLSGKHGSVSLKTLEVYESLRNVNLAKAGFSEEEQDALNKILDDGQQAFCNWLFKQDPNNRNNTELHKMLLDEDLEDLEEESRFPHALKLLSLEDPGLSIKNDNGETVLHLLAKYESELKDLEALLDLRFDILAFDAVGLSPLDYVLLGHHGDVPDMLALMFNTNDGRNLFVEFSEHANQHGIEVNPRDFLFSLLAQMRESIENATGPDGLSEDQEYYLNEIEKNIQALEAYGLSDADQEEDNYLFGDKLEVLEEVIEGWKQAISTAKSARK